MWIFRRRWGAGLVLALLFLGAGALPQSAVSSSLYGSDYRLFASELQSHGAFKFAADTEDLIRSGQFEQAFARYLFLKAHIHGHSLYIALDAMVNQRLHFLKSQMRLDEIPTYATPSFKKLKRRVKKQARAVTPPGTPGPAQKDGQASASPVVIPAAAATGEQKSPVSEPSPAQQALDLVTSPAPPTEPKAAKPTAESKSPEEETPEEKPEAARPAPPASLWDKLKRRLKFW